MYGDAAHGDAAHGHHPFKWLPTTCKWPSTPQPRDFTQPQPCSAPNTPQPCSSPQPCSYTQTQQQITIDLSLNVYTDPTHNIVLGKAMPSSTPRLAKPSHAPPLAKPIHAPPLAKPIHLQNSVSVRYLSRIVMDKKTFFAVLLIMRRIRRKWEENVYKTWSYNLCYSTRWMGTCRNVISLDSPNVEEEEANQILFNGMRNMIQYKHAHRAQASSTDSCSAGLFPNDPQGWECLAKLMILAGRRRRFL